MKVKYSLIPFIPAALAMLVLKLMGIFGVDANGMFLGMDKMGITYTVIGIALGLFVICVIINLFDRKTSQVFPLKRNIIAGLFAIIVGASVIASSVGALTETTVNSEYYVMSIICAVFSVPAGIALMLMSKAHFTGKSEVSGLSMMFVFPALWGCTELVYEFLIATKVSISATDVTSLFCYIFITLYFFSHSMVVSRIKGRNPVKACFIYGLPSVALGIVNGAFIFFTATQEGMALSSILAAVQFICLSLYSLSFIIELFANYYSKDDVEIIDGLPKTEEEYAEDESYYETQDYENMDLAFSNRGPDEEGRHVDPHVIVNEVEQGPSNGLDDFIIGFAQPDEPEEPEPPKPLRKSRKKKADLKNSWRDEDAPRNIEDIDFKVDSDELVMGVDNSDEEDDMIESDDVVLDSAPAVNSESADEHLGFDDLVVDARVDTSLLKKETTPQPSVQPRPVTNKPMSDVDKLLQELEDKK